MTKAGEHFKSFLEGHKQTLREGNIYTAIRSGKKLSTSTAKRATLRIKSSIVQKSNVVPKTTETEAVKTQPRAEDGMFLVQFVDGTTGYVPVDLRGREDIMGILRFPTNINDLYRIIRTKASNYREHEYSEDFESSNYVADMPNLEFSVAIPEGYKDISFIFSNCPKFDCTVIIPSSVRELQGILKDTPAFSKTVYYKGNLSRLDTTTYEHGTIIELS